MKRDKFKWLALSMLCIANVPATAQSKENYMDIQIQTNNGQTIVIALEDNPASQDFASMLPLTLEFKDFAGAEKISYLPRRIETHGSPIASQASGDNDFAYYAPWGNIALFYHGFATDSRLYLLGKILSGKDKLNALDNDFSAKIAVISESR